MIIDEAIEILKARTLAYRKTNFPDRVAALMLGIEALKRVQFERNRKNIGYRQPLSSETGRA